MKRFLLLAIAAAALQQDLHGRSAGWQQVVWREVQVRYLLADLTLVGNPALYRDNAAREKDPDSREAIRLWDAGVRVVNTNLFVRESANDRFDIVYRGTKIAAGPPHFRLNTDLPYPEANVRYFLGDIALGGSLELYRAAAERRQEMGCLEAFRRTEEGFKITDLDQFERKQVDGKTLITRKGSNARISGMEVILSTD